MQINLTINHKDYTLDAAPGDSLLKVLRSLGIFSVKHGCESGECGACTVLFDGQPMNSCVLLAAQAAGHTIATIDASGEHPQQGWKTTAGLSPLQRAFVESGAVQCGFCTPAMILGAIALLDAQPKPTDAAIRTSLEGHLCRCGTYPRIVEAVRLAAQANAKPTQREAKRA